MFSFDNTIGLSAGILTGISMLPQLIKILREKKAKEVSAIMVGILLCGLGLWVYYGVLKNDWPIIITNAFSFLVSSLVLFFKLLYYKKS
jgi:MtN3 and saliva related transmembrane protein